MRIPGGWRAPWDPIVVQRWIDPLDRRGGARWDDDRLYPERVTVECSGWDPQRREWVYLTPKPAD